MVSHTSMNNLSALQREYLHFLPPIPKALETLPQSRILKVGCLLSGGQAAGGHNVLTGLLDALQAMNPRSELIGFKNGPAGVLKNDFITLTQEYLAPYRNQGGFDAIGSGRSKIETDEQFQLALNVVQDHKLDGLIIIGGDDSNTNAFHLAEYFRKMSCKTAVIGVPKTIDGDLQNEKIEISFGFDTACKIYSETIGNIARDALSHKKYYFFCRLMGRSASHITLECALQTQPNMALIGEEIEERKMTLQDVVQEITTLVIERAKANKDYGVILLPEGVIEFLSDLKMLIQEINRLLAEGTSMEYLSPASKAVFELLPESFRAQLLLDRDPHGNVQVSKIETERLFIALVEAELKRLKADVRFSPIPIFCGYEGRASPPSHFDATYCYNLGRSAATLVHAEKSGTMATLQHLAGPTENWIPDGAPLASMMHMEERNGREKLVIKKTLVDLSSRPFKHFAKLRQKWRLDDCYLQPGPIQLFGPSKVTDSRPLTL